MNFHPDVLAAHAEFGGDLESMQKLYEYPTLKAENERLAKERDYWQSQHDERTRQLGELDERALAERAGGVKVKALLNEIASWTQTERLLWWQIKAREALSYFPHEFQQNGPGIVGSDICTICGMEREDHHDIPTLTTEPAAPES